MIKSHTLLAFCPRYLGLGNTAKNYYYPGVMAVYRKTPKLLTIAR